jgi:hypothetical protein
MATLHSSVLGKLSNKNRRHGLRLDQRMKTWLRRVRRTLRGARPTDGQNRPTYPH